MKQPTPTQAKVLRLMSKGHNLVEFRRDGKCSASLGICTIPLPTLRALLANSWIVVTQERSKIIGFGRIVDYGLTPAAREALGLTADDK